MAGQIHLVSTKRRRQVGWGNGMACVSLHGASDLCKLSRSTLRAAIRANELKATKAGEGSYKITRQELNRWVKERGVATVRSFRINVSGVSRWRFEAQQLFRSISPTRPTNNPE
jgi:excisionase family DNA binding protein